jgi:hypothetical protein
MNDPALTPEQWRKWRTEHELTYWPAPEAVGYLFADISDDHGVRFFVEPLRDPGEIRAAIAVLLDALAQAGEPLFTEVDTLVLDATAPHCSMQALEVAGEPKGTVGGAMRSLSARIASLLPPEGL